MTRVFVQDVTLRDGMHALRHRIALDDARRIVSALDVAGVDAIEVSHGDGLSGGSLDYGPGSHTDWEWLEAAAGSIRNARLITLLLAARITNDLNAAVRGNFMEFWAMPTVTPSPARLRSSRFTLRGYPPFTYLNQP
jgi:hypothetical protein